MYVLGLLYVLVMHWLPDDSGVGISLPPPPSQNQNPKLMGSFAYSFVHLPVSDHPFVKQSRRRVCGCASGVPTKYPIILV